MILKREGLIDFLKENTILSEKEIRKNSTVRLEKMSITVLKYLNK